MNTYEKKKYRRSKDWQEFREQFRKGHIDNLTTEPLKQKYVLHHSDLNPEHYTDLNEEKFLGFNSNYEHRMIHYLYTRYVKDPLILQRLEKIIKDMAELNKWKDIKSYR